MYGGGETGSLPLSSLVSIANKQNTSMEGTSGHLPTGNKLKGYESLTQLIRFPY